MISITEGSSNVVPIIDFGPDITWDDHQRVNSSGLGPSRVQDITYFDDCGNFIHKRWIMKGIIARGETSAWIAPPGHGKSALLTEIAVHCAAQRDWRGHKAKEACGVVFLALERADLCKRRLRAYAKRDGLRGLPIAVCGGVIDLRASACVGDIVDVVRKAELQFGCGVGLIIIDTFNKGIAAGGGDEDKARDQNQVAANLRKVQGLLDAHIALVGHTGKNEDRGARGSNALLGDVDVMVQISGDGTKSADVTKGNDQPERALAQFRLQVVDLGVDEDGEKITTALVSVEHEACVTTDRRKSKRDKLPPKSRAGLDALFELVADGEVTPRPDDVHVPVAVTCVTLAKWKERLQKLAIIDAKSGYREQFKRIHVTLKNQGMVGIWDDVAWPVT